MKKHLRNKDHYLEKYFLYIKKKYVVVELIAKLQLGGGFLFEKGTSVWGQGQRENFFKKKVCCIPYSRISISKDKNIKENNLISIINKNKIRY